MAKRAKEPVQDERIRRILEQAEAHGGLKKLDAASALSVQPFAQRTAARFAQLELPFS